MDDVDQADAPSRHPAEVGRSRFGWADSLSEAAAAVGRRPIRTFLTALGTILGVGAFIATSGLAHTARVQVSSRFDALRATEVVVEDASTDPNAANPFPDFPDPSLEALNGVNHAGVIFTIDENGTTEVHNSASRQPGARREPVSVVAATPGGIAATLPTLLTGRIYDSWHETRGEHVTVLGRVAADRLGVSRIDSQPAVFIDGVAYTVIGVLDDSLRRPDLLHAAIIPTRAADLQFDTAMTEREVIIDTQQGAAGLIGDQAPLVLRPQDPGRLRALVPPDPTTFRNQVEGDIESLFYALSALALLVGAVAITNATLLNVVERRPEIGLRRALGATRRHITKQIALEAALTGVLAGVIGGAIGTIAVVLTAFLKGWTPTIDPSLLLAAPLLGVTTGTLAGVIPAFKASRTPPAETLRT